MMATDDEQKSNINLIVFEDEPDRSKRANSFCNIFDPIYADNFTEISDTTESNAEQFSNRLEIPVMRYPPLGRRMSKSVNHTPEPPRKMIPINVTVRPREVSDPFNYDELKTLSQVDNSNASLFSESSNGVILRSPTSSGISAHTPRVRSNSLNNIGNERIYPLLPEDSSDVSYNTQNSSDRDISLSSLHNNSLSRSEEERDRNKRSSQNYQANAQYLHDPEMKNFLSLVKKLRTEWPHSNEECNPGLVYSPMNTQTRGILLDDEAIANSHDTRLFLLPEIMVEIRSELFDKPFKKAVDPNDTTVSDLLIELVFLNAESNGGNVDIDLYALRIFGRSEYLVIFPNKKTAKKLADYIYVQECSRQDYPVLLILEEKSKLPQSMKRKDFDDISPLILPTSTLDRFSASVLKEKNDFLDCYYTEKNKLLAAIRTNLEKGQIRCHLIRFEQSIKAITLALGGFASPDLQNAIITIKILVTRLTYNAEDSGTFGKLEESFSNLEQALSCQVRMYSLLTHSDINLAQLPPPYPPTGDQECRVKPSTECHESVILNLAAVHRVKKQTAEIYDSFRIQLSLIYAGQPLRAYSQTQSTSCSTLLQSTVENATQLSDPETMTEILNAFGSILHYNQWIKFPGYSIKSLPREVLLSVGLFGVKKKSETSNESEREVKQLIGWANFPLFDANGQLNQGHVLIGLWPDCSEARCDITQLNSNQEAVLVQLFLPVFNFPVEFPPYKASDQLDIPPVSGSQLSSIEPLISKYERQILLETKPLFQVSYTQSLNTERGDGEGLTGGPDSIAQFFWSYRACLMERKEAQVAFILSITRHWPPELIGKGFNWSDVFCQVNSLLTLWTSATAPLALRMLAPDVADFQVRRRAVETLRRLLPDELQFYLPQIIEVLKNDIYLNASNIVELLLEFSLRSVQFANALYWQLKECPTNSIHSSRLQIIMCSLLRCVGAGLRKVWQHQEKVIGMLTDTAETVRSASASQRETRMQHCLHELDEFLTDLNKGLTDNFCFRFPFSPGIAGNKLDIKSCSYFKSNTLPLKIAFKNIDEPTFIHQVMFKSGDDLRQDRLITQLFRFMDLVWLSSGLDLRMVHYTVQSTAGKKGLIELVPDCSTLLKVQAFRGGTNSDKNTAIKDWLIAQNTSEYEYKKAIENFLLSCAGCCISTYILGIGDRHNDNILIRQSGHLFHVDFAKIFGEKQKIAKISRDRVEFVLTVDMRHVLEQYDTFEGPGSGMQFFIDKCCEAYIILQRHTSHIVSLLTLLLSANIPAVNEKTIQFVVDNLRPDDSVMEASRHITKLIVKSLKSLWTNLNFIVHEIAQSRKGTMDNTTMFTHTPRVFTIQTEGRIARIEITEIIKQSCGDKTSCYLYKCAVYRVEDPNRSSFVFRRLCQWFELIDRLNERFTLSHELQKLCQTIRQLSSKEDQVVAEGRRATLQDFVNDLLTLADEISQSDIVQTFFHATLNDEQTHQSFISELKNLTIGRSVNVHNSNPKVQLLLNRSLSQLKVLVMHVRNLRTASGNIPDAYVKLYLRPCDNKDTKRKSGTIKKSINPSFNETFQYDISQLDARRVSLEVSLWNQNAFPRQLLGQVKIPLVNIPMGEQYSKAWYDLERPCQHQNSSHNSNSTISYRSATIPKSHSFNRMV